MPSIIQFYHPGGEHGYDYNKDGLLIKDWNTIDIQHKRKFILNEGSYIKNNQKYNGKLLFWGEWEPPSRVEKLKLQENRSQYGRNPEYIHFPFLPFDNQIKLYQDKHIYQNTDPFIFGDNFIYAICRQKMKSLRALKEGSLIIFGSRVNFRFVIDTIFVVKERRPYFSLEDIEKMNLGKYKDIVTKFILNNNDCVKEPEGLVLYKGATFDDPENGMYSFVPAKVYDDKKIGFSRFYMPDDFYEPKNNNINKFFSRCRKDIKIYEGQNQGISIPKPEDKSPDEIYEFWNYLKNEISKDHVLGYNFTMPKTDENFKYREKNYISNPSVKGKPGCN